MSRTQLTKKTGYKLVLATCSLLLVQGVHAQAPALPEHWMEWDNHRAISGDGVGSCGITKQLSMEWDQSLQQIAATLASLGGPMNQYAYASPTGILYRDRSHRDLTANSYQTCSRYPIEGEVIIEVWTEAQVDIPPGGKGRAKLKRVHTEGAGAITVSFNQLPDLAPAYDVFNEARMGFYIPTGTFQGYPVVGTSTYPNFAKRTILITAPGHGQAYIPVPINSVLKLLIPTLKEKIADQEKKIKEAADSISDSSETIKGLRKMGATAKQIQDHQQQMNQIIGMMETELKGNHSQLDNFMVIANLSEAQRTGPAYLKPSMTPGVEFVLLTKPEEGAQTLMMQNPDYFNDKLPRTAKQVMVIHLPQFDYDVVPERRSDEDEKNLSGLWIINLFKQVDWKVVAKSALR